jgi:uncharacterized protein YdiU (UPF0061 family)
VTPPFDNTYARLPTQFFARVQPAGAPAPRLLAWNQSLAEELGLGRLGEDSERLAEMFSGNDLPPGAEPIALAYAGHQFGHFQPQLGDGRALLLGEVVRQSDGKRFDLQLKGSGQTPFSRNGDGRSALGPVIREYLVSEAMHRLGVPTTRALAAVATGERVRRDDLTPGRVLTRVAASHVRVGTFEYFSARRDLDALQALADYVIDRHYPDAAKRDQPLQALFAAIVERQAALVAHWLDLGFIHGVMNTDNMAVSGETIDYGPCAFMDEFDFNKVFSSIDRFGRYAYGAQPGIAQWNLARLAECLLRIDADKSAYEAELARFESLFREQHFARMAAKLGLVEPVDDDADLITDWLQHLQDRQLDYTLSFRELADRLLQDNAPVFGEFEANWKARVLAQGLEPPAVRDRMNAVNPLFIPRNHQVERAIDAAVRGDLSVFNDLREVLQRPFDEQPGREGYAQAPRSEERVMQTFCGT